MYVAISFKGENMMFLKPIQFFFSYEIITFENPSMSSIFQFRY